MKRLMKNGLLMLTGAVLLPVLTAPAHAAKFWDPGEAIQMEIAGDSLPVAPTNVGDNGIQTKEFNVTKFSDKDHWIDPNESAPYNEDSPNEQLQVPADLEYETNAPAPGSLSYADGMDFIYTAPSEGGYFNVKFTGTDATQTINTAAGESGNRHDPNDTDWWWDDDVLGDEGQNGLLVAQRFVAASAASPPAQFSIPTPHVTNKEIRDDGYQLHAVSLFADTKLGLTDPTVNFLSPPPPTVNNPYPKPDALGLGFCKKVEIVFTMVGDHYRDAAGVAHPLTFKWKQEKRGKYELWKNGKLSSSDVDNLWSDDTNVYPQLVTNQVDNQHRLFYYDIPGIPTYGDDGGEDKIWRLFDYDFHDRISYSDPVTGNPKSVDNDAYSVIWHRYVSIHALPGPPPTGTNKQYEVVPPVPPNNNNY